MGWTAYTKGTELNTAEKAAFEEASNAVRQKTGQVDGMLDMGGLDSEACAWALEEATGERVFTEGEWAVEKVQELAKNAQWGPLENTDNQWAQDSARAFLETCGELELGIHFGL